MSGTDVVLKIKIMRKIARYVLALVLALLPGAMPAAGTARFGNETLKYVITYKWGLIHKDAGDATMTLTNSGNRYNIRLVGRTKPWADKFYEVRDTLISVIEKNHFRPLNYTKLAHEGGNYSKDVIDYSYSGNDVTGKVQKYRKKKDKKTPKHETLELNGSGPTFDMLSVFYYLRTLDPSKLESGKKITSTMFSGSHAEKVTIWKVKEERIKMRDGTMRDAWHLRFNFTSKGGKKSSSDIDAWISKDDKRIPLQLRGSLPIGKVNAYLI